VRRTIPPAVQASAAWVLGYQVAAGIASRKCASIFAQVHGEIAVWFGTNTDGRISGRPRGGWNETRRDRCCFGGLKGLAIRRIGPGDIRPPSHPIEGRGLL